MVEFKKLEELRTRKEVEEYFKQLGKEITEEELDALKQSYDKAQETNGALTMQQLDDVAGGLEIFLRRLDACCQSSIKNINLLIAKNAFLLAKKDNTEIRIDSGEKYMAMVQSDINSLYKGFTINLYREEIERWISPTINDLAKHHADLLIGIQKFIGDGEDLKLIPIPGIPVNEEIRDHEKEEQLIHSGKWGPSVLYDSFVNGIDRFEEFSLPYERQILTEEKEWIAFDNMNNNERKDEESCDCCAIC